MEFTLTNKNGMKVVIDSYGATMKEIIFDGEPMICKPPYAASVIGRIAGRISKGEFKLFDKDYKLPANENNNQLHGNHEFDRNDWTGSQFGDSVVLKWFSDAGSNGFPGKVETVVTYTLSEDNEIKIDYFAKTDKATIFNLTNHAYFNLNGGKREVYDHVLKADCNYYVPLKEDLTPVGSLENTLGTVFDLKNGQQIKNAVESEDSQNVIARHGFDHAFVFENCKDYDLYTNDVVHEVTLKDEETNRVVTMKTDYPAFVCYTGNQMKERPHMGVCLEAQLLPDAVNHPGFGSIVLLPEKPFVHFVSYKFSK